jgi:hypothetical protein
MANDYQWNPEEFASQKKLIRAHLLSGKHITQLEALKLYSCLRLSAIIFDLRNDDNLPIVMEKIQVAPRKRVGDYYIKPEDLQNLKTHE